MKKLNTLLVLIAICIGLLGNACMRSVSKSEKKPYIITLYNDQGQIIKGPIEATEVGYPGSNLYYESQGVTYIWKGDFEVIYPLD